MLGRRSRGRWGAWVSLVMVWVALSATPALAQAGGRIPLQLAAAASAGSGAGEVYDTVTLTGGLNPTGTVAFALRGPNDHTCSAAPVFTSVKPVNGAGASAVTVVSDHAFLPAPGVYHFVASYSGDAAHAPAGPTACGDPAQAVAVGTSFITFSAEASPATTVGGKVWDTATIATAAVPTGTMSFSLFGPDATTCDGTPAFTSTTAVNGDGSYRSESYTPTQPGVYRWVAGYSGDADDPSLASSCDDPMQRVHVAPAAPAAPVIGGAGGGPCAVLAQQLRALRPAVPPYVHWAFRDAVSAWFARLDCG